jgi:OmcA/MtrC family decaheme c-type cytochrome
VAVDCFDSFFLEMSMRIPSSVFALGRYALVLAAVAGSVVFMNGQKKTAFSVTDKAAYAPQAVVEYVNPGLVFTIVSDKIASDGTISVDFKITDPNGLPLDLAGVLTPGAVSPRFLVAYIPKGQSQFVSYIATVATAVTGGATATQASTDSGGTTQTVATGEYIYTFKTKAPSGFDATASHRIGIYGSRNLTQWDLGTNYASAFSDFVPAGGTPSPRQVVMQADCNSCHSTLSFHGGSRVGVDLCIMCHTPQSSDPNTGNTVDFKVMIHKIHMGASLPSVQAGGTYQIYGHGGYSDFSTVVYPSNPGDPRNCAGSCHNPKNGAAQTKNWLTNPNRAACGSCHDDVNFATGQNHVNLPQVDDTQCSGCHIPQGELQFDASIIGAHTNPTQSPSAPGINLVITKVQNAAPGKAPSVTFTIRDNSGAGIPMSAMTGGSNRLALVMAGPTSDYGYTSFGSDVTTPGYVSENPVPTATCSTDGTCTYTFTHAIPAKASGTFAIGIEGRRGLTILPGTQKQVTTEYGAKNNVFYFSVDGSPVVPRRTVVSVNNCNSCHTSLSLHGENRNQIEMCVLCHNPSENDASQRPNASVAADKALPPQTVSFGLMVHRIHTGDKLAGAGLTYTIVGFGGSHNEFSGVRYPAMLNGTTGDTPNCMMCHVNNASGTSTAQIFPIGKNPVLDTQGPLSPLPATTAACMGCHVVSASGTASNSALAHAVSQTDPKFGESCDVCHGAGTDFDVLQQHAGK